MSSFRQNNNEWDDVTISLQFPFTFPRKSLSSRFSSLSHRFFTSFGSLNESGDRCMTSASELFSTRRSRPGRSDPDLESDSSSYRHHSHNHHRRHGIHHHNQRHDSDACDPLRRPPPRLRRFCHNPERSRPIRDVQGTAQYLNTNSTDSETESNSLGNLNGSERLPGAVLLARARLFERLRGVSLSSNSGSNRVSLGDDQRESSFQDPILQLECNKKPQGLTQGAINCLHRQTFSSGAEVKTEMRDCSICLESFTKGDKLISLSCNHSFHFSCLNPWLRACGDCPYCRRAIAKE